MRERERGKKVSVKLSLCPRSWTWIIGVRKENEKRREDFHLSFPCHFFSFFQVEWKTEKNGEIMREKERKKKRRSSSYLEWFINPSDRRHVGS